MADLLKGPTFLVGAERSGTTVLRLMLDHHPDIAFHFEFEFAVSQMADDGRFPDVNSYAEWLSRNWIFSGTGHQVDTSLEYPHLVDSFLRQKRDKDGKKLIGSTVHHFYDRLLYIWPEARFIHIVRDPRDVSPSCMGMGWAGNVWTGLNRWLEAEAIWDGLKPTLPAERYFELKYENLIRDPEQWLGNICQFMGAEYHPAMLTYPEHSTYDAPDPTLVYQWRKRMKEEDIRLMEARLGEQLTARGYEPSGLPKMEVGPEQIQALEAHDRKACRQFRIKRYGLPLLVMAKITRHLPFRFAEYYFADKLTEIDRKYIK